jgi:hypothetical protein
VELDHDGGALEAQFPGDPCMEVFIWRMRNAINFAESEAVLRRLRLHLGSGGKYEASYLENPPMEILMSGCSPTMGLHIGCDVVQWPEFPSFSIKHGAALGMHLHYGHNKWGSLSENKKLAFAKRFVGVAQRIAAIPTMLAADDDFSAKRAGFFGCGLFRIKPYGLEYKDVDGAAARSPVFTSIAGSFGRLAFNMILSQHFSLPNGVASQAKRAEMAIMSISDEAVVTALRKRRRDVAKAIWKKIKPACIVYARSVDDTSSPLRDDSCVDMLDRLTFGVHKPKTGVDAWRSCNKWGFSSAFAGK